MAAQAKAHVPVDVAMDVEGVGVWVLALVVHGRPRHQDHPLIRRDDRVPVMQAMPIPYIEPEDVSELVAFLATGKSRYMTGQNIRLDAGAMLKGGTSF